MSDASTSTADQKIFKIGSNIFWVHPSKTYAKMFDVFGSGESWIKKGEPGTMFTTAQAERLLIFGKCLTDAINVQQPTGFNAFYISIGGTLPGEVGFPNDASAFSEFFTAWKGNTCTLSRELTTDHFSWPGICENPSKLKSEGDNDVPTFTMGEDSTRWLPAAYWGQNPKIGAITLAGTKEPAVMKFLAEVKGWIPMGVELAIKVGMDIDIRMAWLNAGEIVLRGPLNATQFAIKKITFAKYAPFSYQGQLVAQADFQVIEATGIDVKSLPPRPYVVGGTDNEDQKVAKLRAWWNQTATKTFMLSVQSQLKN